MTYKELIETYGIGFTCKQVNSRPDSLMSDAKYITRHFKCSISCGKRKFTLYFSQGSAHTQPPNMVDVLDSMASDAAGIENASGFEDFAAEYGYDVDSRAAEKVYKVAKRQTEQLKRTIGTDAYSILLWEVERQ